MCGMYQSAALSSLKQPLEGQVWRRRTLVDRKRQALIVTNVLLVIITHFLLLSYGLQGDLGAANQAAQEVC